MLKKQTNPQTKENWSRTWGHPGSLLAAGDYINFGRALLGKWGWGENRGRELKGSMKRRRLGESILDLLGVSGSWKQAKPCSPCHPCATSAAEPSAGALGHFCFLAADWKCIFKARRDVTRESQRKGVDGQDVLYSKALGEDRASNESGVASLVILSPGLPI